MSQTKVIDVPEIEDEISTLVNIMLHLCQWYEQVQMRALTDEINLPNFGRLFELIGQIEMMYVEEIIRFQVSRGQKITWFEVEPLKKIEKCKLSTILKTMLETEKDLYEMTFQLSKCSWENGDLALTAFLNDRIIPRQVKAIRKRANQLIDMKRNKDNVTNFLIDRLNIRYEVEKLEKILRLEILRREVETNTTHGSMMVPK